MLIRIDPTREAPVFAQIAASIRADIVAGTVGPGDRLPSAKQVAASLGVNLHTVLHAYKQLREEGLVDMRPGRGAVVTAAASPAAGLRDDIRRLVERAASLGISRDALANLVRDASGNETQRATASPRASTPRAARGDGASSDTARTTGGTP